MKITLITHTPEPEKIIASAAKLCYSSSDIKSLMDGLTQEKVESFIKRLADFGHESPLEHCTFTFGIEGVSRALLAQLTRHRIASYSVKSQRYVEEDKFSYVVPSDISKNDEAFETYVKTMDVISDSYNKLTDILYNIHKETMDQKAARKKAIEDARYVLPNACSTQLIMTMNIRSLLNFFELRCCNRAQAEIRELADSMLEICKEVSPNIFAKAGASCVRGKCKEGKMCCGNPKGGK